jgi:hypothetical protein
MAHAISTNFAGNLFRPNKYLGLYVTEECKDASMSVIVA